MLIPTSKNTRNITDFRKDPEDIIAAAKRLDGPLYLFRQSEPQAVILDIDEYIRLREMIEDYQDELLALELESDKTRNQELVSFDQVLKENKIKLPKRKRNG